MRRKKIIEASVVCILLLLLGAYMEFSSRSMDDKNRIIRGSPGSGRQEVELTLNAGEQLKDYDYQISVPAQCIDEKTAQSYFSRAEKEIDETFFPEGEEAAHVTEQVHMKPSYVKGLVKADWTLDQYNAVDVDGTIREDQLDPQGQVNCIDSDENDGKKMKYLTESYSKLFALRGGLSDFIIYDADVQLRNQLNEKYNDKVKKVWNIMKDYI